MTKRPLVPVIFKYKDIVSDPYLCLVDSGADSAYLDSGVAAELGIDLSKHKSDTSFGITGQPFKCWIVNLIAEIGGHEFPLAVNFSEEIGRPFCVLGQQGLFDNARVVFERYKWNLEIVPKFRN